MDNQDSYVWAIFLFIWAVVSIITRLAKKKTEEKPAAPAVEAKPTAASERARQIQEEIRRKIAERQQQEEQPPMRPAPATAPVPATPTPAYQEESPTPMRAPPPVAIKTSRLETGKTAGAHPQPRPLEPEKAPMDAAATYEAALTRKIIRLRTALQESELAMQNLRGKSLVVSSQMMPAKNISRQDILEAFKNPIRTRQAFIYSEIFGPPNAFRPMGSFAPLAR